MENNDEKKPRIKIKSVSGKSKITKLEQEVLEYKDKYLRSVAELDNYKKRIQQERATERKYAAGSFILELLNPYEQLSIICEMPTDNDMLKNYLIGFKMIKDQIGSVLVNEGVKEIDALNHQFDPNFHHAVEKEENKDIPSNQVVKVLQKGFMYKDRLLRPAMVKVNEWSDNNGEDK